MMDIRTTFMVEKAVYAFNGTVQRLEVSECGDYLATVGFTINAEHFKKETIKVWDMQGNMPCFNLLHEEIFDEDVKMMKFYSLRNPYSGDKRRRVPCLVICYDHKINLYIVEGPKFQTYQI